MNRISANIHIEDLALLVTTLERRPKSISVARQVVLKAMCETKVVVQLSAWPGRDSSHENVAKHHACMTTKRILAVYRGHLFYITIADLGKVDVNLQRCLEVGEVVNAPKEIVHVEDERYRPGHKQTQVNVPSLMYKPVHYKPTPDRLEKLVQHEAAKEKDEGTIKRG